MPDIETITITRDVFESLVEAAIELQGLITWQRDGGYQRQANHYWEIANLAELSVKIRDAKPTKANL